MVDYGFLAQMAATDRNPAQETDYQNALRDAGISFTTDGGKTNVSGFGIGGNGTGPQAQSFFSPQGITAANTAAANNKSVTDAITAGNAKFDSLVSSGKQDVTDFLTKYAGDTSQVIGDTQAKYGIPQQVGTVNALNSRIQDLTGNLSNSGAGGFASSNQVDAALNTRYLPTYNTAVSNLNTSETAAQNEATQRLAPDVAAGSLLNDRLAREMTGFTTEQQTTLGGLLDLLSQGTTLTKAQMDNANSLAIAQLGYNSTLNTLNAGQNRIVTVPQGNKVFQVAPVGSTGSTNTSGASSTPLSFGDLSAWIAANAS